MNNGVCKEILEQAQECYDQLEALSQMLRELKNESVLSIFEYSKKGVFENNEETLAKAEDLLSQCAQGLNCVASSVRDEEKFLATFQNAEFMVNSVMISADRIAKINLRDDLATSITIVENTSNELFHAISEFKAKEDLIDF